MLRSRTSETALSLSLKASRRRCRFHKQIQSSNENMYSTSAAATAFRLTTMDNPSSSSSSNSSISSSSLHSSSTVHLGSSRLIDRHNPIITDSKRAPKSSPSISPPQTKTAPPTPKNDKTSRSKKKKNMKGSGSSDFGRESSSVGAGGTFSCAKGCDFSSPPGSTRYLLGERTGFLEVFSDLDPVLPSVPGVEPTKASPEVVKESVDAEAGSTSNRTSPSLSSSQVVVLRVSLHCKGCAGKVKKHISRMQGVTSFNIDFAANKVTVVGDVTPLQVLASISKVKTVQLWTPAKAPSSFPLTAPSTSSNNKQSEEVVG